MSIRTRLEDAAILYKSGRKEGALLMALVAIAATSRKRYPDETTRSRRNPSNMMGDAEAFTTFVMDEIAGILGFNVIDDFLIAYHGNDPRIIR